MPHKSFDHVHHVAQIPLLREPLSVVNAKDLHALVVFQVRKKFRRDEEVLSTIGLASDLHHRIVDIAFRALVHTLREPTGRY